MNINGMLLGKAYYLEKEYQKSIDNYAGMLQNDENNADALETS